jgi:hypothetical protein
LIGRVLGHVDGDGCCWRVWRHRCGTVLWWRCSCCVHGNRMGHGDRAREHAGVALRWGVCCVGSRDRIRCRRRRRRTRCNRNGGARNRERLIIRLRTDRQVLWLRLNRGHRRLSMNSHIRIKRHSPSTPHPPQIPIIPSSSSQRTLPLQQTPLSFILQPKSLQTLLANQRLIPPCLLFQCLCFFRLVSPGFVETQLAFHGFCAAGEEGAHFAYLSCGEGMDGSGGDKGFKDKGRFVADSTCQRELLGCMAPFARGASGAGVAHVLRQARISTPLSSSWAWKRRIGKAVCGE